jgi:CRISPR-associated protein Csm2
MPFNANWITGTCLSVDAVKEAENLGKKLAPENNDSNAMTSSQLRNFFGGLKKIQLEAKVQKDEEFNLLKVKLLKPKLAYAKGRATSTPKTKYNRIGIFYDEVAVAIDAIQTKQHLLNFVDWIEAVVAYHKFYGGN